MKDLLKNLGLISILAGVVILSIAVFKETQTNTKLIVSLILVIAGLLGHILLNKYIE
jgi:hypothetical protein